MGSGGQLGLRRCIGCVVCECVCVGVCWLVGVIRRTTLKRLRDIIMPDLPSPQDILHFLLKNVRGVMGLRG